MSISAAKQVGDFDDEQSLPEFEPSPSKSLSLSQSSSSQPSSQKYSSMTLNIDEILRERQEDAAVDANIQQMAAATAAAASVDDALSEVHGAELIDEIERTTRLTADYGGEPVGLFFAEPTTPAARWASSDDRLFHLLLSSTADYSFFNEVVPRFFAPDGEGVITFAHVLTVIAAIGVDLDVLLPPGGAFDRLRAFVLGLTTPLTSSSSGCYSSSSSVATSPERGEPPMKRLKISVRGKPPSLASPPAVVEPASAAGMKAAPTERQLEEIGVLLRHVLRCGSRRHHAAWTVDERAAFVYAMLRLSLENALFDRYSYLLARCAASMFGCNDDDHRVATIVVAATPALSTQPRAFVRAVDELFLQQTSSAGCLHFVTCFAFDVLRRMLDAIGTAGDADEDGVESGDIQELLAEAEWCCRRALLGGVAKLDRALDETNVVHLFVAVQMLGALLHLALGYDGGGGAAANRVGDMLDALMHAPQMRHGRPNCDGLQVQRAIDACRALIRRRALPSEIVKG